MDLDDAYTEAISDVSDTRLGLTIGPRTKRVENHWGEERIDPWGHEVENWRIHEALDLIADLIDSSVGIEQWIGTRDERDALFRGGRGRPGSTRTRKPRER